MVLVGLLGKVLGPIGFLWAALNKELPWQLGWTIITNDLVWWLPFCGILLGAYRAAKPQPTGISAAKKIQKAK